MQWRLVIFKIFVSNALLALFAAHLHALDASRLWLPKHYQKYYLDLVQAAEAAEALERCTTVLEGTLDREQSLPDYPIYRILCRQGNGRSYNEMVDGKSFTPLTTIIEVPTELTQAEKALLQQQEEERKRAELEQQKAEAWQVCDAHLRERVQLMIDPVFLTATQPEPQSVTEHTVTFLVDFDAKNVWGKPLKYSAQCIYRPDQLVNVKINKRL